MTRTLPLQTYTEAHTHPCTQARRHTHTHTHIDEDVHGDTGKATKERKKELKNDDFGYFFFMLL